MSTATTYRVKAGHRGNPAPGTIVTVERAGGPLRLVLTANGHDVRSCGLHVKASALEVVA